MKRKTRIGRWGDNSRDGTGTGKGVGGTWSLTFLDHLFLFRVTCSCKVSTVFRNATTERKTNCGLIPNRRVEKAAERGLEPV